MKWRGGRALGLLLCGALAAVDGAAAVAGRQSQSSAGAGPLDVHARAWRPGEVVRVEWEAGGVPAGNGVQQAEVRAFGRAVPAYRVDTRWQALVGIDLDQAPGEYDVVAVAGTGQALGSRHITLEPARFTTRVLKVDPDFVNPPASVMPRIRREAQLMQDTFAASAAERYWSGPFIRPVPHRANSRFGQRSVFNGEPRNSHTGTDFLSPTGTPVRAPQAGRVVIARDLYFSGGTVVIDHGLGVFSLLAHLSRVGTTEGAAVAAGDVVGLVGATGRVTGAHLHWGLRLGGARVDPLALVDVLSAPALPSGLR